MKFTLAILLEDRISQKPPYQLSKKYFIKYFENLNKLFYIFKLWNCNNPKEQIYADGIYGNFISVFI